LLDPSDATHTDERREHVSDATIDVNELRKRFGSTQALDGMTFAVSPGRVTGFVGPNGAGKSTTIRVILGLDGADGGTALVCGRPYVELEHPLRQVGSLIDSGALQPSRTGRNHLAWIARSQGLGLRRVDEVIEQVGLSSAARRKAGGYSLGMRQRLGIAVALRDPPILILDEPFNGMDPDGIIWVRELLRSLAAEGRAVLVSTHLMGELQGMADHVIAVGRGRVLADANVSELLAHASRDEVRVRTSAPLAAVQTLRDAGADVTLGDDETLSVSGLPAERVAQLLSAAQVPAFEIAANHATLEEAYLQLTSGESQYAASEHRESLR
jgi:ABC-2 type transport system ATP-binding protein